MTFKELLDKVSFDEIAPHIRRMYPNQLKCIGWYKLHYDMLRLLTPEYDPDANSQTCTISMEKWDEDDKMHLTAYPMEGDLWTASLCKEMVFEPEVKASLPEIVACCLWETSFYGFTPQQLDETFHQFAIGDNEYEFVRNTSKRNISIIRRAGGYVPSLKELHPTQKAELIQKAKESCYFEGKMNKSKRKGVFHKEFMMHYYTRIEAISEFIISVIPALDKKKNSFSIEQLCGLFKSLLFYSVSITSFVSDEMHISSALYLKEIVDKYEIIASPMQRMIICIVTGQNHDSLTPDERELGESIARYARESADIILMTDPALGEQTRIELALFCSEEPLVK